MQITWSLFSLDRNCNATVLARQQLSWTKSFACLFKTRHLKATSIFHTCLLNKGRLHLLQMSTKTDWPNQRVHIDMYRPTIYAKSKFQVMSDILQLWLNILQLLHYRCVWSITTVWWIIAITDTLHRWLDLGKSTSHTSNSITQSVSWESLKL